MRTDGFALPRPDVADSRLPFVIPMSRAAALERWARGIAVISLVQLAIVSIGAAFQSHPIVPGDGQIDPTIHAVLSTILLPLAFVGLLRWSERRLLHRPPKALLVWQFVVFGVGTAAITASTLRLQNGALPSLPLFAFGHGALALSFLSLLVWFGAVAIASASEADR